MSLFTDDMILYTENSKDNQIKKKKTVDLINEFSEVARYKVNIQKSVAFLYTNNEFSETTKKIPFT